MQRVAIFCEIIRNHELSEASFELISKMYELKSKAYELSNEAEYIIDAIVVGACINEKSIEKAYKAGCDKVVLIKDETYENIHATVYTQAFSEYYKTIKPYDIILFPATQKMRMIAPRITTNLNTGLVADCTNLELILKDNELKLASTRPTFGSELMATIISKSKPQCSTIRPNTFKANYNCDKKGEYVEYIGNSYSEFRIKTLQTVIEKIGKDVDFQKSKIVFCAGFGLNGNNAEYYKKLQKIADKLSIPLAATRKVVDFNLMDKSLQIGQTGATISPDLYIGFGVSGAIQHVIGMKHSKKIIAINIDENAEIFKYSDYKIVEDAKKIIDELYEKLLDKQSS